MALGHSRTTTFKEGTSHGFIILFRLAQLLTRVHMYLQEHIFSTDIKDLNLNIQYIVSTLPFGKDTLYINI